MDPLDTTPGGNPVTAVPGLTPRSPEIIEGPVLVTVVPANTAKDVAVPNPTGGWTDAANAAGAPAMSAAAAIVPTVNTALNLRRRLCPQALSVTDVTNSPRSRNIPDGQHARE